MFASLFVSFLTVLISWQDLPFLSTDSYWYIEMAEGRTQNVVKPFSTRILHPMTVAVLKGISGLNTHQSFFMVGLLALGILTMTLSSIIKSVTPYPAITIAFVLFTPFFLNLFKDYYLPDLFHAAALGLYFLLLVHNKLRSSLLVLFLLCLTRESTILLTLSVTLVSWYRSQRKWALAALITTAVGILVVSVAGQGQQNIHAMNDQLYMLLKIPFNFAKNVLGLQLWTNTLAGQSGGYCTPVYTIDVPAWLALGSIRTVGICAVDPMMPLRTIGILVTIFGIAPTVVIFDIARNHRQFVHTKPYILVLCQT
ncbi:MAG: hypothetical protein QXI12_02630 [Candidatus Methanomethyliaceae archaeon]